MSEFVDEFESRLTDRYGEFVPPSSLWKEFRFATPASFRTALSQNRSRWKSSTSRGAVVRSPARDVARWQATAVYASRRRHATQKKLSAVNAGAR